MGEHEPFDDGPVSIDIPIFIAFYVFHASFLSMLNISLDH